MGGGRSAATPTKSVPCFSAQRVMRSMNRGEACLLSAAPPPLRPASQVRYPPTTDPATAQAMKEIASLPEVYRCAVRNSRSRSVVPGTGSGIIDESISETAKSPTPPSPTSQRKRCELDGEPALVTSRSWSNIVRFHHVGRVHFSLFPAKRAPDEASLLRSKHLTHCVRCTSASLLVH